MHRKFSKDIYICGVYTWAKSILERSKRWVSTPFLSYFITNKSLKKYSIRNDVVFMILKSKKVLKSIIQFFQSFFSENFP